MSRQIFLPELLSINIKNYTLYPNGLDYTYDFVKGINLVLGGNGMGKTTFVNIIKFAILGLYRKPFGYGRTYQDRLIEKRKSFPNAYFSKRMDSSVAIDDDAIVTIKFKANGAVFQVTRTFVNPTLKEVRVNDLALLGNIVSHAKYESYSDSNKSDVIEKESCLQYAYEQAIEKYVGMSFDDLIFFINEVLFFGENHRTILWNDASEDALEADVQNELFNKYFNDPQLEIQRQNAIRKTKYFDSLSRHKSEDMRPLKKTLEKLREKTENSKKSIEPAEHVMKLRDNITQADLKLANIQSLRLAKSQEILFLQTEINTDSQMANDADKDVLNLEQELHNKQWMRLHPDYEMHIKNIQLNHLCPMCSHQNDELAERVSLHPLECFVCETSIETATNVNLKEALDCAVIKRNKLYTKIKNNQRTIKRLETEIAKLDYDFRETDLQKRQLQQSLREVEYTASMNDNKDTNLQVILDEIEMLNKQKDEYQKMSMEQREKAEDIASKIDDEVKRNVQRFSAIFSSYARNFLGVECYLTYEKLKNRRRQRFYPVIEGKVREFEEELSESQRFFIDHSFRMSILTFFYTTPTFYVVETPDSSLDISYEKNAAEVFLRFLQNPNSIIITSNLNNSTFVSNLIKSTLTETRIVDLIKIAKKSNIQSLSPQMMSIYDDIIRVNRYGN